MKKINAKLLSARGFKSEKDLTDFLKNCKDENWIKELKEYYGLVNKEEVETEEEIIEDKETESEEDTETEVIEDEEDTDSEEDTETEVIEDEEDTDSEDLQEEEKSKDKVKEEL